MRKGIACLGLALLAGCGGEKPVLERGWIGGRYEALVQRPCPLLPLPSRPRAVRKSLSAASSGRTQAVLVSGLREGTPAHAAGLREGDLILEADGEPVEAPADLQDRIDGAKPGSAVSLRIWRAGEMREISVTIGRERYRQRGFLSVGLSLSPTIRILPPTQLNLLGLVRFDRDRERADLQDARRRTEAALDPRLGPPIPSPEVWRVWLLILGVGSSKEILSQEPIR